MTNNAATIDAAAIQTRYRRFHALHHRSRPLALANAWDVASAVVVAQAGAAAVATTSAGLAWSLGCPDGHAVDRDRVLAVIARIVGAVDVPVTADIEGGYAIDAAGVADTIRGVRAAGAVGVNLEDTDHGACYRGAGYRGADGHEAGGHGTDGHGTDGHGADDRGADDRGVGDRGGDTSLLSLDEAVDRIMAAREAADTSLFINARIDTFLRRIGTFETMLSETVRRAEAYVDAGADGIFVPGVAEPMVIRELVRSVKAPLNILVGPGSPSVGELGQLGVARVSLGSSVATSAYSVAMRAASELLATGTYESVSSEALGYTEMNALMSARP